jgi:oligosaccharide repeat unit polymerase
VFLAILFISSVCGGAGGFWIALGLFVGLIGLRLAWRLLVQANEWTKRCDFFAPGVAFVLAYLAWFGIGSANLFNVPDSIMAGTFSPIPLTQWGFYGLGLAAYGLGLWFGKVKMPVDPRSLEFRNDWVPSRFWGLIVILTLIMFGSAAAQISQFGVPGLSTLAGEERLGIRGVPHFLFASCAFTIVVLVPAYLWSRSTTRWVRIAPTLLVLCIVVALPLLQGGRSDLVVSLLTVFLIFHYLRRRATLFPLFGLGVATVVILSLAGYLRDYFLTSGKGMGWLEMLGLPEWMVPMTYVLLYVRYDVANFRDITSIIPSRVPYQHGALTFAAFKSLLAGAHEMSDMFFKNLLGGQFVGGGQPATLLGPLYGDYGALGIFAGMFLFGLIAAKAYNTIFRRQTLLSVILYAWILQTGFMGLFGSLFTYITTLTIPILWALIDRLARNSATSGASTTGHPPRWATPRAS